MAVASCSSSWAPPLEAQLGRRPLARRIVAARCTTDASPRPGALPFGLYHVSSIRRPMLWRSSRLEDSETEMLSLDDDDVAVEGVIKVGKEKPARPSWGRALALASGDLLALLAFASVGRLSHGFSALDWEVVRTADPFIAAIAYAFFFVFFLNVFCFVIFLGWILAAYLLGGFGPEGQGLYGLRTATFSVAKSWAVGIPLGLAIRGFTTGHPPALPFVLVSMGSTLVVLVTWRAAFTAVFPNVDKSIKGEAATKKGSILELLELLTSLVRRW